MARGLPRRAAPSGDPARPQVSKRLAIKRKEVDDVMGGAAAWENAPKTDGVSQSCRDALGLCHTLIPCLQPAALSASTGVRITSSCRFGRRTSP